MDSEGVRVAELLRYFPLSDRACTALIERLSGASFAEVSDTSAGIAIGRLGTMIDTARRLIARAASVQATQHPSTQTTLVDDDREEGDSAAFTTLVNATPFWPHVQRTQPHVAQASTSTSTSTSATMPASFWPGVVRREESTQTTQTTQSAQSNEDAADWRVALKDVLSGWSEREDIDKDEMVALLQAFVAELEAKV